MDPDRAGVSPISPIKHAVSPFTASGTVDWMPEPETSVGSNASHVAPRRGDESPHISSMLAVAGAPSVVVWMRARSGDPSVRSLGASLSAVVQSAASHPLQMRWSPL